MGQDHDVKAIKNAMADFGKFRELDFNLIFLKLPQLASSAVIRPGRRRALDPTRGAPFKPGQQRTRDGIVTAGGYRSGCERRMGARLLNFKIIALSPLSRTTPYGAARHLVPSGRRLLTAG